MEHTLAQVLAAPLVLDQVRVIRRDLDRHHVDCVRHARLLAARLRAHGRDNRPTPDAVLGAWLHTTLNGYDPVLAVRALFAAQSLKVTTYEVLEQGAAAADDSAIAGLARHHRVDEEARRRRMARVWSSALLSIPSIAATLVNALAAQGWGPEASADPP